MRLSGVVFSKILGMDTNITIVAPKVLNEISQYKVVYLLHGLSGNNKTWIDYSMLTYYAREGKTIYVLPEVNRSFYTNMKYGLNYYTYITDELPTICKNLFNISSDRENTAIIGASMGGYGALKCALLKPEQYGMCAAFAPCCLFLKDEVEEVRKSNIDRKYIDRFGSQLENDMIAVFGEDLKVSESDDIWEVAKNLNDKEVKPKIYIAVGKNDILYDENIKFKNAMQNFDFDFTFEEWEGTHNFTFFDEGLNRAIKKFDL